MSRARILIAPTNDTQAKMFLRICHELRPTVDIYFLTYDAFEWQKAATVLSRAEWPIVPVNVLHNIKFPAFLPRLAHRFISILIARRRIFETLDKIAPDLVAVGIDHEWLEYLTVRWAIEHNKPSLLVQDGLRRKLKQPHKSRYSRWRQQMRDWALHRLSPMKGHGGGYAHSGCTRIAVMGPASRANLLEEGIPAESLLISGQPRYDDMRLAPTSRHVAADQAPVVVYADQPFGLWECSDEEERLFVTELLRQLDQTPQIRPFIKLHPRTSHTRIQSWIDDANLSKVKIADEPDMLKLLESTNLLITVNSTVGVEAVAHGIPLIAVEFPGSPWAEPYTPGGVATKVVDLQQLSATVSGILFDHKSIPDLATRQAFVFDHAYSLDGKAARRVAIAIEKLIDASTVTQEDLVI